MVDHITSVIDDVDLWMLAADALQCIFQRLPRLIALEANGNVLKMIYTLQ